MANSYFEVDASGIDGLAEKMETFGAGSGQVIQKYLKDDGFRRIASHIPSLIHASGRKWKGKAASATAASYTSVFTSEVESTTLTIRSGKSKYGYLYFPDDGSNTVHHTGNQQFMLRGAEDEAETVASEICSRLVAEFEKS